MDASVMDSSSTTVEWTDSRPWRLDCRRHGQLCCCTSHQAGAATRLAITRCQAADNSSNPEQHSRGHLKALLDGIATARRHGLDWLRRQSLPTRHDDSNQQEERIALVHSPQDVEEVLATLAQQSLLHSGSSAEQPAAVAAEEKASLEALREAAAQHTGLAVEELAARTEVLCNLVPGVKEEQLLRLRPEVLREICSDAGASAAAARLVQLRTQDPGAPSEELRAVLRCPRLLTHSGQRAARVTELKCRSRIKHLAFAQQGRTLVTLDGWDGKVGVWDLQAAQPSCTLIRREFTGLIDNDSLSLEAIAVCPDGRHIVVGGGSDVDDFEQQSLLSLLGVIDLETGQWVAEATLSSRSYSSIALVPGNGGKQLVVTADESENIEVWELDMGYGVCAKPKLKRKQIIPNSAFVYEVAAVPGTQSVLTGGETLELWSDLADKHRKERWLGRSAYILAVCPQGRLAATTSRWPLGNVSVWDLQTGREVTTRTAPDTNPFEPVNCLAISPDGRYMVGGGADCQCGTLFIWDLQSFEQIAAVEGGKKLITCLAFSPDGQVLATGDSAGLVRLWDWGELLAGG